jgi:hypothetical protein
MDLDDINARADIVTNTNNTNTENLKPSGKIPFKSNKEETVITLTLAPPNGKPVEVYSVELTLEYNVDGFKVEYLDPDTGNWITVTKVN